MQEYERDSVLEQYDIVTDSTRKTRGAILCDTDKGLYILKEVTVSQAKIPALFELYEYLAGQGHIKADYPIKNREGEYISLSQTGDKYMLKQWSSGRECNVHSTAELLRAAGNLAKLHLVMRGDLNSSVSASMHMKDEYMRHNRELKKVRKFVRGVSPKGEFEFAFLKYFDKMYNLASTAVDMIENSDYDELYQESIAGSHMIHGEYNYHNILITQTPAAAGVMITNFERFKKGVQVEDLYYFLRKVMEKHGWRERLGDSIINAYSAIKPLDIKEIEYMKLRLIYPEKFWKIADSYYRSNKAWISVKNIEKMNMAVRQTEEKEKFLSNIFSFQMG